MVEMFNYHIQDLICCYNCRYFYEGVEGKTYCYQIKDVNGFPFQPSYFGRCDQWEN